MFAPAKTRRASRQQISFTASVPAPVGGWNARDPLGAMDPKDAVILQNWFPKPSYCVMRSGYTNQATGIPGTVESVMGYSAPNGGNSRLFAASNNAGACAIYDVTSSGAVGAAVVSGLTSARFSHVNFTTPGGSFLYLVNGADAPRHWNGTVWTTPAITGIATPSQLVDVTVHKSRLWFAQTNSLSLWYLPVNSVAGAAVEFPLGSILRAGGSIAAIGNWTIDAGQGVDDHLVVVTTEGEVAVYKGSDPSSAALWYLVGVWRIGSPMGRRCLMKFAGDLLIICKDGLLAMSAALQSTRIDNRASLSDKILNAMSEATSTYSANYGWEVELFPLENMVILNVPTSSTEAEQYVMNTISRAWCKFTGWNARCWELYSDNIYFGGAGFVGRAWNGTSDNGAAINASALPAFNYFGGRTGLKQWTMARPVLSVSGVPGISLGLSVDFDTAPPTNNPSFVVNNIAFWGTATWGSSLWGGFRVLKDWQSVSGLGYCAAMFLQVSSTTAQTEWTSVDYAFQGGGVL